MTVIKQADESVASCGCPIAISPSSRAGYENVASHVTFWASVSSFVKLR